MTRRETSAARRAAVTLGAALLGFAAAIAVDSCSVVDFQANSDKPEQAEAASLQADLQNVAAQVRTWFASDSANPSLMEANQQYYLCAAADVGNVEACTAVGPVSQGANLRLYAFDAGNFCVEGNLDDSDEVWRQNASGGVESGAC
ncbi:MAG: hypothetical protein LBD90_03270 [Bifidobacteriaceae bacterium]|jgi:hypothetical protein|nr:hypothetical protein [Bifidobacteriaceae bacterium]